MNVTRPSTGPALPLFAVVIAFTVTAWFGLLFGSFASVPIYRWPRGGTVMQPQRSECPGCDSQIRAVDNIPVLSWFLLGGQCRTCNMSISRRYPAIEATTGVLFVAIAAAEGATWLLPALLTLTWAAVVAALIVHDGHPLPMQLVRWLLPATVAMVAFAALQQDLWNAFAQSMAVTAAAAVLLLAVSQVSARASSGPVITSATVPYLAAFVAVASYRSVWQGAALLLLTLGSLAVQRLRRGQRHAALTVSTIGVATFILAPIVVSVASSV